MMIDLKLLNPMQVKIYGLLVRRLEYVDMPEQVGLSFGGVKFHVNRIFMLLNYKNRIELVCDYYENNDQYTLTLPAIYGQLIGEDKDMLLYTLKGYSVLDIRDSTGKCQKKLKVSRQRVLNMLGVSDALKLIHDCYGVYDVV